MMYAYLKDQGKSYTIPDAETGERTGIHTSVLRNIAEAIGEERISKYLLYYDDPDIISEIDSLLKKNGVSGVSVDVYSDEMPDDLEVLDPADLLEDALDSVDDDPFGLGSKRVDTARAKTEMRAMIDEEGFDRWLHGLFDQADLGEYIEKPEYRMNRETGDGYIERVKARPTLENIVDAMRGQPEQSENGMREYASVEEARANRGRLGGKTGYFEAKPRRAVGFDEVLAAVVPEGTSAEVTEGLRGKGVNVLTYRAGDNASRLAAVNSVEGARFSLKDDSGEAELRALEKENRRLRERVEYWKGQTKPSVRGTVDQKAVERAARELLKAYDSRLDAQDIAPRLKALYDYLGTGKSGNNELTWEGAREMAGDLARDIARSALTADDETYRQYAELRAFLRGTKIRVPDSMWADLDSEGGYSAFRKANLGRINLSSSKGAGIGQVFQELSENWPEFFREGETLAPADQLILMADVANSVGRITEYNPFSYNMDQRFPARDPQQPQPPGPQVVRRRRR